MKPRSSTSKQSNKIFASKVSLLDGRKNIRFPYNLLGFFKYRKVSLSLPWQLINIININRYEIWVTNMKQKGGGKVDQLVLKCGDFIAIVQQKLIDSTLSVEQMETTADIPPMASAMHRKLTINNDHLLFQS